MDSQTPPTPEPTPPTAPPISPADDIAKNKDLAALSYFWILSLVVYWAKRDSPFVRFHARQGVTLFILSLVFAFIPVVRQVLELLVLLACAAGFVNAAQGKQNDLPLVAAIARMDWKQLRVDWQNTVAIIAKLWNSIMSQAGKDMKTAAPPSPETPPAAPSDQSPPTPPVTPA